MKRTLILAAALLVSAGAADAKWWIFGKARTEVGLSYLYINGISADETGPRIKLFREMLGPEGLVRIKGRAAGGQPGAVRITLDDKATWQDVKFASNGTFEYSFKPEAGRTYVMLIEVTDTSGKTNKVEETRKEITLSDESVQAKVKETLDGMFDAYSREDLPKFMSYVADDFAADKGILERAVKRDFDALSSISIRYTINNVAAGAQGRVFVSITYSRMVFVNKTGTTSTDTGATEFVFDYTDGKLALFSMKQPLMFGLSDASGVATGETPGNTAANLVLDDSGNLGGTGTLVTITCSGANYPAYKFSDGSKGCGAGAGDIWFYDASLFGTPGIGSGAGVTGEHTFSGVMLSGLTAAQVRGAVYAPAPSITGVGPGSSYCYKTVSSDYYCVEPLTLPTPSDESVTFRVGQF